MPPITRSPVSPAIAVVLWIAIVTCAIAGLALMFEGSFLLWNVGLLTLLSGSVLPLWMLLRTHYRLEEDRLVAVSGPFRWRVDYRDIQSIRREPTMIAGPALSMDRLLITYGGYRFLVISPRSPEVFQKALEALTEKAQTENTPGS